MSSLLLSGVSTDSTYSHFAWASQPRKEGGLGPDLKLPLIADRNQKISRDYGVLIEEEGVALRGLFIIDPKGTLRSVLQRLPEILHAVANSWRAGYRQITVNDLPVGRSVEETIRLVKAFQFTVRTLSAHLASASVNLIPLSGRARRGLPRRLAQRRKDHEGRPQGQPRVLCRPERRERREKRCERCLLT